MKKLEVVFCNSSFDDNYGESFQCTLVWENNDGLKERMKIITEKVELVFRSYYADYDDSGLTKSEIDILES